MRSDNTITAVFGLGTGGVYYIPWTVYTFLADVDEVQTMFQQPGTQALRGRVRVDMSTAQARQAVIPRLPELLQLHPLLELEISSTERRVDVVREGFDCVLRAGAAADRRMASADWLSEPISSASSSSSGRRWSGSTV